jgi:hypothetical protein
MVFKELSSCCSVSYLVYVFMFYVFQRSVRRIKEQFWIDSSSIISKLKLFLGDGDGCCYEVGNFNCCMNAAF